MIALTSNASVFRPKGVSETTKNYCLKSTRQHIEVSTTTEAEYD